MYLKLRKYCNFESNILDVRGTSFQRERLNEPRELHTRSNFDLGDFLLGVSRRNLTVKDFFIDTGFFKKSFFLFFSFFDSFEKRVRLVF